MDLDILLKKHHKDATVSEPLPIHARRAILFLATGSSGTLSRDDYNPSDTTVVLEVEGKQTPIEDRPVCVI
jgi:hypothetical protein